MRAHPGVLAERSADEDSTVVLHPDSAGAVNARPRAQRGELTGGWRRVKRGCDPAFERELGMDRAIRSEDNVQGRTGDRAVIIPHLQSENRFLNSGREIRENEREAGLPSESHAVFEPLIRGERSAHREAEEIRRSANSRGLIIEKVLHELRRPALNVEAKS